MLRFVIDRTGKLLGDQGSEWFVAEQKPNAPRLFTGSALACIAFCESKGAVRRGPRVYVVDGK